MLGCVITIGAGLYEAGHAMRTEMQSIGFKIGELDGKDTKRARRLAGVMNDVAGSKVPTNFFGERCSKLTVNCMTNPIAGLSGLGSAEVRSMAGSARIAVQLAAETISVGRKCGFEVGPIYGIDTKSFVEAAAGARADELPADMAAGAKGLAGGRPSMLQDAIRGRRTEIDNLNGYVVDQGRRVEVKTLFNEMIVHLVHQHGVRTLKPFPENLDPLMRMLPR